MMCTGLSLIFEVGGDVQKIAGDSSCCSRGYTSQYEGKIPGPWPLMTALGAAECFDTQ